MKPANFRYARTRDLDEAVHILGGDETGAKILAGGQSLGPMLNLRLVQPEILVDVTTVPALTSVRDEGDAVLFGACVTHSAVEDGRVPEPHPRLPASGRRRHCPSGRAQSWNLGGSIAHADPAADWLTALFARLFMRQ